MRLQIILALTAFILCEAKLPRFKAFTEPNDINNRLLDTRSHQQEIKTNKTSRIIDQYRSKKFKRSVFDSKSYESSLIWPHSERLDNVGDIVLRWVTSDSSITFKVEAKTLGYVGIGFNLKSDMKSADLVIGWVDDYSGNAQILDCHGLETQNKAVSDDVQNYELISGYQNKTHTTIEFRRQLDTCDGQDFVIREDTIQVLWALGPKGSDGQLPPHESSGSRPLRLLQPVPKPESIPLRQWDVTLKDVRVPHNMATLFWCKIFKAPELPSKHHIVGYQPLIDSKPLRNGVPLPEKTNPSPVHHMVLYECADDTETQMWNKWAEGKGTYGPSRPRTWSVCVTPIAAWAMGSNGEFLPENVGIPLGERGGVSFYMLEVHYDNQALHEVLDNSGIRIHYTPALRAHDAALLGSGIGVSALHVIPPRQPHYKTVGICSPQCSNHTLPDEGINIVSVLLHAHGTARKISLKHIRGNEELPRISEENTYDARYQQSRVVQGNRKFLREDTLITECTYDTTGRDKPILGGYSASQEMCLSFVLYYPRTELAGCYSMTPVKEFFETFGVLEFYDMNMVTVENLFLSTGSFDSLPPVINEYDQQLESTYSDETVKQGDDQGVGLLKELVIKEPAEFRNKTFIAHINEIAWKEPLLTKEIQKRLYRGAHLTFCKKRDDSWGAPVEIQTYPIYRELSDNETAEKSCHYKSVILPSVTGSVSSASPVLPLKICLVFISILLYVNR